MFTNTNPIQYLFQTAHIMNIDIETFVHLKLVLVIRVIINVINLWRAGTLWHYEEHDKNF
jgi:hypothetical protein